MNSQWFMLCFCYVSADLKYDADLNVFSNLNVISAILAEMLDTSTHALYKHEFKNMPTQVTFNLFCS